MNDSTVQATKRCSKCGDTKPTRFLQPAPGDTRRAQHHMQALHTREACGPAPLPAGGTSKFRPIAERFAEKLTTGAPDECWPWRGRRNAKGYGAIDLGHGSALAHRVAFCLASGRDLESIAGQSVCHHCDNPPCCNPAHLYAGDAAQNAADKVARGRQQRLRGTDNPRSVLTEADVRAIRARAAAGESTATIATDHGITRVMVGRIVRRQNWQHVA